MLFDCHFFNQLVKEKVSAIEDLKGKVGIFFRLFLFKEFVEDEGNLRRVIPISRFETILNSGFFGHVLDGENGLSIKVIEHLNNIVDLCLSLSIRVMLEYLRKEHLSDSDHASPSCVSDIGIVEVVGKLWKTGPISDPDSASEELVDFFVDFFYVRLFRFKFVS